MPLEYVKWVENPDNGLLVQTEQEGFIFKLQYKPIEYIIAVQERRKRLPEATVTQARKELSGMQYFTFKIRPEKEDQALLDKTKMTVSEFDQRLGYFSFSMQKDLLLVDGQDSLPCLLFHHEPTYGLTGEETFLLGFDLPIEPSLYSPKELLYKDSFLGTGQVSVTIQEAALTSIPALNLN